MPTTSLPEARFTLTIAPDGTLLFLWDDALAPLLHLGESAIRRASYVEPEGTKWIADLYPAGGPILGPFPLRSDALTAERDWLLKHLSLDPLP